MKLQLKNRFTPCDLLAALVCAALFGYFFVAVRYGIRAPDESFYLAVAQRFAKGDRPLVDEWQLSQFAELLLAPLFRLFTRLTGGTEGVILCMRQVFLLFNFGCYWWFYKKLRSYGVGAVVAVAIFVGYIPSAIFALNYYTLSLRLLLGVCLALFFPSGKAPSKGELLLAGVALSVAVLAEPPLALLYVVYSAAVFVFVFAKKRKPNFGEDVAKFFDLRRWAYLSAAVAVCAAAFLVYLCVRSGVKNILAALPELFSDSEYDFSATGNVRGFLLAKLSGAAYLFGRLHLVLSALLCAVTFWVTKIKKTAKGRRVLLLLNVLLLLSCCFYPVLKNPDGLRSSFHLLYYVSAPLPFYTFGLVNDLLCERKDCRLFLLWLVGLLSSLCMDSFSDISFANGAIFCVFPGVLCFGELMREFSANRELSKLSGGKIQTNNRNRRAFTAVCMAGFVLFLGWAGLHAYLEGTALFAENIVASNQNAPKKMKRITTGSHKGLYTTETLHDSYDALLADVETIRAMTDGAVYVDPPDAVAFLNLNRPIANCSSWDAKSARNRQVRYFSTHTEKLPQVLYWMDKSSLCLWDYRPEQVALLAELSEQLCEGDETEGRLGRMVLVERWKDLTDPALANWLNTYKTRF